MTRNETEWIKENSKKLIQQAQSEKGVELNIQVDQPQLYFENAPELKNADEVVKKILSLEYASRADFKRYEEELLKNIFQRDLIDQDSLEIQIALHTLNIRRMCNNLKEFTNKNKRVEFLLYRAIHRRDRLMSQLFYKDNKRFEWLKEKLNLNDYKLKESYSYRRETKYETFIKQVNLKAEKQRVAKLDAVRADFEKEKKTFYQQRDQILADIQREIEELGFKDIKFPTTKSAQQL